MVSRTTQVVRGRPPALPERADTRLFRSSPYSKLCPRALRRSARPPKATMGSGKLRAVVEKHSALDRELTHFENSRLNPLGSRVHPEPLRCAQGRWQRRANRLATLSLQRARAVVSWFFTGRHRFGR